VVIYRTAQQQSNDIFSLAMSILFMGIMFGLAKSLVDDNSEAEKVYTKLLPQTKWKSDKKVWTKLVHADSENEGELVPSRYRDLVGWINNPVPDYKLGLELLPAVDAAAGAYKIDSVLKQLKEGVEGIQQSQNFRQFLLTMAKFHNYSIGNLILIMLQKPEASHVAGFTTWKDLHRWVKQGEKGIAIMAPCMPPKIKKSNPADATDPDIDEDKESDDPRPRYFKVVYVFDVSQTEGKPLPEVEVPVLTGEANEVLFENVLRLARDQDLAVSFESRPQQDPSIKGMFYGKNIWVRPEEARAQQLKTIIHEMAHYYSENVFRIQRKDAETIAESVAFTIGAHYGFDTGTRSFPYVALWSQDKKVLEANLAAIRNVSGKIFEALDAIQKRLTGVV
jgi:hypothetical protein